MNPQTATMRLPFSLILMVYMVILSILILLAYHHPHSSMDAQARLKQISQSTSPILSSLIKTKYFRMIRINLQQQCPLNFQAKLCKSKSCAVCRCDEKDIPIEWIKTDKVISMNGQKVDVWSQERQSNLNNNWVWHVEDEQNDKGEYFDIHQNVQSFTSYNGTYIWKLIYEENCFDHRNGAEQMCFEERVFFRLISGLHTSISSHLSMLYRNITKVVEWADTGEAKFYLNQSQYEKRVYSHPQRVQNLLFLYEILLKSIIKIVPYLQQHIISSDNITEDLHSTQLLKQFLQVLEQFPPSTNSSDLDTFLNPDNPTIKQYQLYFHNISRILNCVECQKCRLFGKMQTYGVGTAIKILLGYVQPYKRNQLVALFNTLNKITKSVDFYFNYGGREDDWLWVKIFGVVGGSLIVFIWLISKIKINMSQKLRSKFKNTIPNKFKAL